MAIQKVRKFKLEKGSKVGSRQVMLGLGKSDGAQEVHRELKQLAQENGLTIGEATLQMLRFVLDQKNA